MARPPVHLRLDRADGLPEHGEARLDRVGEQLAASRELLRLLEQALAIAEARSFSPERIARLRTHRTACSERIKALADELLWLAYSAGHPVGYSIGGGPR